MTTPLSSLTYAAVIKIVPLAIEWVLREGCVMATTAATEMVWDAKAVVDQAISIFLFRGENVRAHVKAFEWELYQGVQFLASEPILAPGSLKALQADYHDTGHAIYFKRLSSLNVLLALIAVPLVVLIERFWLLELLEAVVQLYLTWETWGVAGIRRWVELGSRLRGR